MKKIIAITLLAVLFLPVFSGYAHAGMLSTVKGWLTGEVIAIIFSTLLALLGGALGLVFRKISRTFKEAGEFLTTLGLAIEDKRITREELANIISEGRDVFGAWK